MMDEDKKNTPDNNKITTTDKLKKIANKYWWVGAIVLPGGVVIAGIYLYKAIKKK